LVGGTYVPNKSKSEEVGTTLIVSAAIVSVIKISKQIWSATVTLTVSVVPKSIAGAASCTT
jgi:hypothetical protein